MRDEIIQCPHQFNTAVRQDIVEEHREPWDKKNVFMCHK